MHRFKVSYLLLSSIAFFILIIGGAYAYVTKAANDVANGEINQGPVISQANPSSVFPGDLMNLYGTNFNEDYNEVYFGETLLDAYPSFDGTITMNVPDDTQPGNYEIYVVNDYGTSSSAFVSVTNDPYADYDSDYDDGLYIDSLSATSGPVGLSLLISGNGFPATGLGMEIVMNGNVIPKADLLNTQSLRFTVPSDIGLLNGVTYPIFVRVKQSDGTAIASNQLFFTISGTNTPTLPTINDPDSDPVLQNVGPLTWQKCVIGTSGSDCSDGDLQRLTYAEATSTCNSLTEGGYGGWRLPTQPELSQFNQNLTKNPKYAEGNFPNTPQDFLWTKSRYTKATAGPLSKTKYVVFSDGTADVGLIAYTSFGARCVRDSSTSYIIEQRNSEIDNTFSPEKFDNRTLR